MAYTTCVTSGCETDLPEVQISEDCPGDIFGSEIEEWYVAKHDAAPFADWSDAAEWATRLSQSLSVGNEIRKLIVTGDKPAAQSVIVNLSKRKKKRTDANHTLNLDIDDVNQKNYDFATKLQCGSYKRIWYKTRGGHLFGGNEGILVYVDINPVLGRGDEIEKINVVCTWNNKQDPERIDSPI